MNPWHCSALVCRLANRTDALSPLCPQLFYSHTCKHKSPLCLREHSGGSHLTLPELGAYQEQIPACLRRQTITPSDQSGGAKWHLNSSSCSVYIMYIPRQWGRDRVTGGKERNRGGWGVKSKQWKAHWWEETYIVNDVARVSVLWLTALVPLNVPQRSARNHLEHNFIVVQNLLHIPTKGYKKWRRISVLQLGYHPELEPPEWAK